MGKLKLLRLVIALLGIGVCAQGVRVDYALVARPNKADKSIQDNVIFSLLIDTDNKRSLFKLKPSQNDTDGTEEFSGAYLFLVHKNYMAGTLHHIQPINQNYYKTQYPLVRDWDIADEEKVFLNHKVQKANLTFGGREWEAWYTEDIPIMDGPYKFCGLPGLILEVRSLDDDYRFTAVGIKNEEINLSIPKNIEITQDELIGFKSRVKQDPAGSLKQAVARLQSQGTSLSYSFNGNKGDEKDLIKKAEEDYAVFLKKYDNPIEKNDIWLK